jgi:hypothetical protein
MIKDVIADHFSGNPQPGCRASYPINRFYVQVDWVCKQWPTSKEQSIRRSWMKPVDGDALVELIGSV